MFNSIVVSLLAAVICGVLGVVILQKNYTMLTGGIAHTSFGGVGLAILLGFNTTIGAAIFAGASALYIGKAKSSLEKSSDVSISLLWALGMSLGIIFSSMAGSSMAAVEGALFGDIMNSGQAEILLLGITAVLLVVMVSAYYHPLMLFMSDEEFAEIRGINTNKAEQLLLFIVALSIVALLKVTGIILIIALLSAPAAAAGSITTSLPQRMIIAGIISFISCIGGVALSNAYNINSGGAIALIAVVIYFTIKGFTSSKAVI